MINPIFDAQGLLPYFGHRGLAETDMGKLVGRTAPNPGAVGIFIGARFVGDFQVIEAVGLVPGTVITVGVGLEMKFTDVGRAVAIGRQQAGQRDRILGNWHAHMGDAEGGGILPGEEAEAAGHTDGVLHEAVVEVDALACQPVEVGRVDIFVAVCAQGIPALLVGVDDEEIGTAHRAGLRPV